MGRTTLALSALSLSSLLACGGAPAALYGQAKAGGKMEPAMEVPPDMAKPVVKYPEGPYGYEVGDVMDDFTVEGFRLSTETKDWSMEKLEWVDDIKLADYNANPECKCLLITFSATWCGQCQNEQAMLPGEIKDDPSLCVMNIHIEGPGNGSGKVSKEDVETWVDRYNQNYPVVLGEASHKQMWSPYAKMGSIGLPFNLVVEPRSMKVATEAIQGFTPMIRQLALDACSAAE